MSFVKIIMLLSFGFVLSGCSIFGVGKSDFSCPGYKSGVSCMSAQEVYEKTNNRDVLDNEILAKEKENEREKMYVNDPFIECIEGIGCLFAGDTDASKQPVSKANSKGVQIGRTIPQDAPKRFRPPITNNDVIPVLTPTQVMRVWVAPWQDEENRLHLGQYMFIQVKNSQWNFGNVRREYSPTLNKN